MKYCSICGSKLYTTNMNKEYCSNCGIIKDGEIEEEEDKNSSGSYIG